MTPVTHAPIETRIRQAVHTIARASGSVSEICVSQVLCMRLSMAYALSLP